jgi:serine acetyltransferase
MSILSHAMGARGIQVLSNSQIGVRKIITAGAVVPRGVCAPGTYAGVPAKLKRVLG